MDNPQSATNPLEFQLNLWEDYLSVKKEEFLTNKQQDKLIERWHASQLNEYETEMNAEPLLTTKDRQFLIAGLIGEYQYLCHDDADIDDMTPEEHHSVLIHYSDAELLEDSDLIESPYETAEEFYDTHSSYCPYEYQVQ